MRDDDQPLSPDAPTPVLCLACGGDYEKLIETMTGHRVVRCRWCIRGAMTEARIKRWRAHQEQM